mmetsp:Transcript_7607/g.25005  ORF Transcript_7607/g.25005 Transcript_7607/m.25005 type:complete len:232 (-) Transcript_7607:473-1168(-)
MGDRARVGSGHRSGAASCRNRLRRRSVPVGMAGQGVRQPRGRRVRPTAYRPGRHDPGARHRPGRRPGPSRRGTASCVAPACVQLPPGFSRAARPAAPSTHRRQSCAIGRAARRFRTSPEAQGDSLLRPRRFCRAWCVCTRNRPSASRRTTCPAPPARGVRQAGFPVDPPRRELVLPAGHDAPLRCCRIQPRARRRARALSRCARRTRQRTASCRCPKATAVVGKGRRFGWR